MQAIDPGEVRVVYPGASAEEVEETVCLAIEDALDGVGGIDELTCTAGANVGIVNVEMIYGHDVGRMLIDVKTEIDAFDNRVEYMADLTKPIM